MTVPPLLESLVQALSVSPAEDAAACSEAVQRVIAGEAEGLDEAFGLLPGPGERHWRTVAALHRRDDLIRKVAAEHFVGLPHREAAERIASELGRFRASHDWRRARAATACPLFGIKAAWWSILKLIDRDLGSSRIRQVLANELPSID